MLIYTYPMCSTTTSNLSSTEILSVPLGSCIKNNGFNHDPNCGECYCQPYIDGDIFTIQLIIPRIEQLDRIDIYDLNGNLLGSQGFTGGQSVTIWNEYGVQSTTQIEMSELRNIAGVDCFYLNFIYDTVSYRSEPYCLLKCNESSVLICSTYDRVDCNGKVWGYNNELYKTPGIDVPMNNCIRLKAVLELNDAAIENTYEEVDTTISSIVKHTKSKMTEVRDLRIWSVAEWQVLNIKSILGGKSLSVENQSGKDYYQVKGGLAKNNDKSSMWFPIVKLEKICQIFNKTC